jgi:predicted esterase
LEKNKNNGKLFIAGFSQGCNMSLYSFFSCRDKIDAVIGISGFLFPIVPFWPTDRYHHVLYGTEDKLRPWEYGKHTFYGKIGM